MSEQEIREGMLLAVWDEPPLDFDPDRLMKRVEQKKSRRRALVTVGVATAMIVVSAFALPGLLPRGSDGGQLASEGQSTVPTTSSSTLREQRQKIGDALMDKLRQTRPALTELYASFDWPKTGIKQEIPLQPVRPSSDDLYGFVYFTDGIGPTALLVTTGSAVTKNQVCTSEAIFCRDVGQKDGSVVTEAEFQQGPELVKAVSMRKFGDGDRMVIISSYSHNPATANGYRQTIPVGVDVLTALITDPDVRWE